MKKPFQATKRLIAIVGAILLMVLAACNSTADQSPLVPSATSKCQTLDEKNKRIVPQNTTTDPDNPTYHDIQEQILQIISDEELSGEERAAKLDTLYGSLSGLRIEGWCGWVKAVTPTEQVYSALNQPIDPYPFSVWVLIRPNIYESSPPDTELAIDTDLIIDDVPLSQVDQLVTWHDPASKIDRVPQLIEFSGTINYVSGDGFISVTNGNIKLAK